MHDTDVGARIRKRRQALGWEQRELARRVGVHVNSVQKWESGTHYPGRKLGKLEEVLGISLSGPPRQEDLAAEDDWEAAILADPNLTAREKREIILRSRRLRAELYPGVTLRRPPDRPPAEGSPAEERRSSAG